MTLKIIFVWAILQIVQCCLAAKHDTSSTSENISSVRHNAKLVHNPVMSEIKERTRSSVHQLSKDNGAKNVTRSMNLDSFIANHKEDIVRLIKGIILPKLKARAMQNSANRDQYRNLDKEAMNYELGYFLGLQKAFRKNPFLGGEHGDQNMIPLKIGIKKLGLAQAKSKAEPMTGYTSVTVPLHKIISTPVHESFGNLLSRYGVKDPGFLKQITKATDGNDILEFAGKHNLDVFAERKNLQGISEYLSKRSFKNHKMNKKEKRGKIPKKDDVMGGIPMVIANDPEVKKYEPLAEVSSGPNPLENVPTPIEKTVSKADNISPTELEGIINNNGGKVDWGEISGIIAKGRQSSDIQDDTPEVGRVYQDNRHDEEENHADNVEGHGREPEEQRENMEQDDEQMENMEPESEDNTENHARDGLRENMEQEREEQTENMESDDGQNRDGKIEKRTFSIRPSTASVNEFEKDRNELRQVIKEIINKLSEIPERSENEKRKRIYPSPYYKHVIIPHYFRPFALPVNRLNGFMHRPVRNWKRSTIVPRPVPVFRYYRRSETPQDYQISTKPVKGEEQNEYGYPSTIPQSAYVNVPDSSGVDAYAFDPSKEKKKPGIESYIAKPISDNYKDAVALLNRGSAIDDSLGDNLQRNFMQKFFLPSSPSLYKRFINAKQEKLPMVIRLPFRYKRSNVNSKRKSYLHPKHHSHVQRKAKIPKDPVMKKSSNTRKKNKVAHERGQRKTKKFLTKYNYNSTDVDGAKKQSIPLLSDIDNFVSPAVFEKSEENFFSKGGKRISTLPYVSMGDSFVQGDSRSLRPDKAFDIKDSNLIQKMSSPTIEQYGTLQQVSPSVNGYDTSSLNNNNQLHNTGERSQFVGDRHVSPAIHIYKDQVVSSGGDSPVMEIKSLAGGNLNENTVETQGHGSIETSNNIEVMKSPSTGDEMEAGNFVPPNEQYNMGDANQEMASSSAVHQTGYNQYNAEDVTGEAKQAISNTIAALDKGIVGQGRELEACCTADQNAPCCNPDAPISNEQQNNVNKMALGQTSGGVATAAENTGNPEQQNDAATLNKIAEDRLMQNMNSMSKNLDTELLGTIHNGVVTKEANHVYLPDENFDGIDWQIQHQPKTGPQAYNAHSSKDIQLLSDPFFQPGIGHQINRQPNVGSAIQSTAINTAANAQNLKFGQGSERSANADASLKLPNAGSVAVTDANNAGPFIEKVDVSSAAKVLNTGRQTAPSPLLAGPAANVIATATSTEANRKVPAQVADVQNAVNTAVNAIDNAKQAQSSGKTPGGGGANNAKVTEAIQAALNAIKNAKQTAAEADNKLAANTPMITNSVTPDLVTQNSLGHQQAIHQLQKEITTNAEQAAVGMNNKISNKIKNAATMNYIADVNNAAASKIASNNEHATELHEMANAITSANNHVAKQANFLVGNAQNMAGQELHTSDKQQTGAAASSLRSSDSYNQTVHDLHHDMFNKAEQAAVGVNNKFAAKISNAGTLHYITDIKNSAASKISENNAHAAELHQTANSITSANDNVAAQAKKLVGNAKRIAGQELHMPSEAIEHTQFHPLNSSLNIQSHTIDEIEADANRVADINHNALHMGTYVNADTLHSVNPAVIGGVLSQDNIEETLRTPVVHHIGNMHVFGQHDDMHPQIVDVTPMTPGGIQFTSSVAGGAGMTANTGLGSIGGGELFPGADGGILGSASDAANGAGISSPNKGGATGDATGVGSGGAAGQAAGADAGGAAGQAPGTSAGGAAGQSAGADSGSTAGKAAEASAGGAAGQAAGAGAGSSAGKAAGASAGGAAGQAAGAGLSSASGQAAGAGAGNAAGKAAGASAGASAGQAAGATAGAAAGKASGSVAGAAAGLSGGLSTTNAASVTSSGAAGNDFVQPDKSGSEKIGKTGGEMTSGSKPSSSKANSRTTSVNESAENDDKNSANLMNTTIKGGMNNSSYPGARNIDGNKETNAKNSEEHVSVKEEEKVGQGEKRDDSDGKVKHRVNLNGNNETSVESNESKVNFEENFNNNTFKTSNETESKSINEENQRKFTSNQSSSGPQENMEDIDHGEESSFTESDSNTPTDTSNDLSDTSSSFTDSESDKNTSSNDEDNSANEAADNQNSEDFNNDSNTEQNESEETNSMNNDDSSDSYQYSESETENANEQSPEDISSARKTKVRKTKAHKIADSTESKPSSLTQIESDEEFHGNPLTDENYAGTSSRSGKKESESRHLIKTFHRVHNKNRYNTRNRLRKKKPKRLSKGRRQKFNVENGNDFGQKKKNIGRFGHKNRRLSINANSVRKANTHKHNGELKGSFDKQLPKNVTDLKLRNSSEFFLIKTHNISDVNNQDADMNTEQDTEATGKNEFFLPDKQSEIINNFHLSQSATEHLLPEDRKKLESIQKLLSIAQLKSLQQETPVQETALTRMLKPLRKRPLKKVQGINSIKEQDKTELADYRSLVKNALNQIEGIKKSLAQTSGNVGSIENQAKKRKYKDTLHEALAEISGIRKSLMQPGTSQKLLTTALAVSNLANLLKQSTRLFNSLNKKTTNGVSIQPVASLSSAMQKNNDQTAMLPGSNAAASIVTGNLLMPGSGGALLNPAADSAPVTIHENQPITSSDMLASKEKSRNTVSQSTKDIYAEIGSTAVDALEPANASSKHHSDKETKEST